MSDLVYMLNLVGIGVFAISGALVASRKELDLFGFAFIALVTSVGGGTLRDLLLGQTPVFWVQDPWNVAPAIAASIVVFFAAPWVQHRYKVLLWADALGMSLFAVIGASVALEAGTNPLVAVFMGGISATFGGVIRDIICNEVPLLLRKELYITPAIIGSAIVVYLPALLPSFSGGMIVGFSAAFIIRGLGIYYGISSPAYKSRPGREYP